MATIEHTYTTDADAHAARRRLINAGTEVSLVAGDTRHDPMRYTFDEVVTDEVWAERQQAGDDALAMRAANVARDRKFGNKVDSNRSNDYWHARGQHVNGAISDCAQCVAECNTRALGARELNNRAEKIAIGRHLVEVSLTADEALTVEVGTYSEPIDAIPTDLGEDDEPDEDEPECEGHESLRGDSMGATVYCDGSCVA